MAANAHLNRIIDFLNAIHSGTGGYFTTAQLSMFLVVYQTPGMNMRDVSARVPMLTYSSVSRTATKLMNMGLLQLDEHPDNRKMVLLRLTPKGNALIAKGIASITGRQS